ncbi:MAG: hypothetical protein FJY85_24465, partial [Deltaproteobacteria bacterium]|nr:hypothetical protein [Deltaproteobacteria bacterium]
MKLRGLYAMLLSLLVGVVSIMAGGFCLAQMVPQPPFMVPYTPGMTSGLFYFNGGVKFRNIQTVAFKIVPHAVSQVASLGTVPWGPEVEGSVFYPYDAAAVPPLPTGNPAEDPDRSGIWEYDDGIIDPRASTDVCAQNPIAFTSVGGNRALGHRAAPENNIGRFTVAVPSTQTDNRGGTYQGTTHITFSRRIDGRTAFEIASRIFQVSFDTDRQLEFTHKIWTPYLELGYRASSFFDVLFGVSWFTLSDTSLTRAHSYAYLHRRIFNDTFRFVGDDTQSWPALGFSSVVTHGAPPVGCTVSTNPVATQNYALYPAGTGGGRDLPTRVFTFGVDPTVPP